MQRMIDILFGNDFPCRYLLILLIGRLAFQHIFNHFFHICLFHIVIMMAGGFESGHEHGIGNVASCNGTLLVKYWKNIVDWLKDFIPKLKMAWKRVRPMLPYAAIIVGDKLWEAGSALVAVMHRLYYKENGEWIEQTTTRKVEESEVPAHIRDRLKNEETNITHEIEEELELTV